MTEMPIKVVLAFRNVRGVGRVTLRRLLGKILRYEDTFAAFTEAARTQAKLDASSEQLRAAWNDAERQLEIAQQYAMRYTVHGHSSYPEQLNALKDPPVLLFYRGTFDTARQAVAVIGTRNPTDWGLATAAACASKLASSGAAIVSGLALGIDAAAHRATVESNGITWAVLAHGLHTISPASHRLLADQILEHNGALISEYPPGERAQRSYFVERDRIQAGLARAVLVIETGIEGGSMHTVRFGKEAGRPIWVTFPERLHQPSVDPHALPEAQKGTWQLLEQGATRVITAADLTALWNALPPHETSRRTMF
jgi:DNA processing protein